MEYPIAEIFIAPQGEGFNVGKLMTFVRLAGCTVGKRYPDKEYNKDGNHSGLFPMYTNKCTLADGREFPCDTDYGMKFKTGYASLKARIEKEANGCKQICLTGGEPLMHAAANASVTSSVLSDLVLRLAHDGYTINLETSGTIPLTEEILFLFDGPISHVCVSPKLGFRQEYLQHGDEFKILVDENFKWDMFPYLNAVSLDLNKVFLQPVNHEHTVNVANIERCLAIQKEHPQVRISLQSHKLWNTR